MPTLPAMPSSAVALPASRRLRPSWIQAVLAVGLILAIWFIVSFAHTMADLSAATARAAAVRADNAGLTQRLAAAQKESALLQSDAYLRFAARSFGMGGPGERAFGLAPGAPAPQPMVPLGDSVATPKPATPLDDWLTLLFGN
jgi:cell division protein FtsB